MDDLTPTSVTVRIDLHVVVTDPDSVIERARDRANDLWSDSPEPDDRHRLSAALTGLANQDLGVALSLLTDPSGLFGGADTAAVSTDEYGGADIRPPAPEGQYDTDELQITVLSRTFRPSLS